MVKPFLSLASDGDIQQNIRGSALILALFVMIVIALLGATLMEILATSSEGVAQEVLGTRALAAANSAMQGELQKLFPLNGTGGGVCPATQPQPYDFTAIAGLYNCKAQVTCNNYVTGSDGTKYFRLKSTGTCGDLTTMQANSKEVVVSQRVVQVEARSL